MSQWHTLQEIREKVTVERERRRAMDELKQISAIRIWAWRGMRVLLCENEANNGGLSPQ